MTEQEVLDRLDNSNYEFYGQFVSLGFVYSYLIDVRLNVFRSANNEWGIAVERLGYNPRRGCLSLDIDYFGNCLINLQYYNNKPTNTQYVSPMDNDQFFSSLEGECLKPDAKFWLVRGQKIVLSHSKQDYIDAGIKLKEYKPNKISAEEAGRLVVQKHRELFRATDEELYKYIPKNLKKILVLDEWYHKDFYLRYMPEMTDEQLERTYETNKKLTGHALMDIETFISLYRHNELMRDEQNREAWENNRPGSYETWQQIAKVIVTNDTSYYKPSLKPNTHWLNWPESGSL